MMNIDCYQEHRGAWVYTISITEDDRKFYAHSFADLVLAVEHYFKADHGYGKTSCPICKEIRK
jgi:hypothetical protein